MRYGVFTMNPTSSRPSFRPLGKYRALLVNVVPTPPDIAINPASAASSANIQYLGNGSPIFS